MRPIKSNARRRSLGRTVLLAILAIVLGGAGTVALLGATNVIDLGKLAFWRNKVDHPPGWLPIPLSARVIPAYTKVTRDYLLNPKTGDFVLKWVQPDKIPSDLVMNVSKIVNRVLAREKPAGYAFSENDFLPAGTRPGMTAGVPPGKRAITLDAGKLKGVHELQEGDHVDLLASVSVDMPGAGTSNSGRSGTSVMMTPNTLLLPKRGVVKPLVEDGVVVSPVKTRNVPTTVSSLMQGATPRMMPVQEIVLAVAPEEVAPLAEAMDLKYEITCVARSGRAEVAESSPNPSHPSMTNSGPTQVKSAAGAPGDRPAVSSPQQPARAAEAAHDRTDGADRKVKPVGTALAKKADITPGLDPMADIRFMEVMIGTQRQFMLFNGPGSSPVVAARDDTSAKAGAGTATGVPGAAPANAAE